MPAICRVITGVSGSPRNLPALRWAAALARSHAADLIPVLAWVPPGSELAERRYPSPYLQREWRQAAWEHLHDAIDTALGGLPADMTAQPQVIRGQPGLVLVQAAGRARDLLVIGTGRRGTLGAGRPAHLAGTGSRPRPVRLGVPVPRAEPERANRHPLTCHHEPVL